MITIRASVGSGKFTWWFLLNLAFACQYPCNSIIDPFPHSPYTFSFHNFGNRLTWPPRRLHVILLPSVCYPSAILLRSLPSAIHSGFLPLVPSVLILAIRGPLGVIFCTQDQQMADWSPTDLEE